MAFGKILLALLATAGTTAGVVSLASSSEPEDSATVIRVVDGDTFEADVAGVSATIRLLNVDTPETKDPDEAVQCLGPEATAFLRERLPVGSTVSLGYDNVRLDRYGRTLAGVTTADGMLVNAEIARAGLGVPVEFDGNVRYLDPVEDAWDEAASARRGLLDPQRDCTISGRVEDVEAARAALPGLTSAESSSAEQLEAAATRAATVAATARAIYDGFNGPSSAKVWAALSPTDRARLQTRARFVADAAAGAESFFRTTAGQARTRETAPQSPPQTHVTGPPTAVTPPAARVATPKPTTPKPATPRPAPPATRTAPSGGGSGCQPGYSPCVPLYPPDLDCSDLAGPYTVTGSDPHRLDADKDGKGCE